MSICADADADTAPFDEDVMDVQQQQQPPPALAQHEPTTTSSSSSTPPPTPRTLKRKVQCSPVLAVEGQGEPSAASSDRRKRRVLEEVDEAAAAAAAQKQSRQQRHTVLTLWRSLGDAYDHTFGLDHKSYRAEEELVTSPLAALLRVGVAAEAKLINACLQDGTEEDDDDVEEDDAEPGSQQDKDKDKDDDEDTTDVEEDDGGDGMVTTNEQRDEEKKGEKGEKGVEQGELSRIKERKESPSKATQSAASTTSSSSSSSSSSTTAAAAAAARVPSKAEQLLLHAIEAPTPMPMIRLGLRRQYQRARALYQRADEDSAEAMETEAWVESATGTEVERHLTRFSPRGPLLFGEDYIATIKERERREAERWTRNISASSTTTSGGGGGGGGNASSTGGGTGVRHRRQRRRGRRRQQSNYSFESVDSDESCDGSDCSEEDNGDWADEDGGGGGEDDESNPGDRFGIDHDYETAIVPHGADVELPRQRQSSSTSTSTTSSSSTTTTTTTTSNSALQEVSPSGKRRRLETSPSRPDGDEDDVGERFSMADDDYDTQNDDSETIVPRPPLLNIDPAMEAGSDESDEDTQPME